MQITQQKDFVAHHSNSWWVKSVKTLKDFVCTHWTYEFTEEDNANTHQTMYFFMKGTYLQNKQTEKNPLNFYRHTCTFWHPKGDYNILLTSTKGYSQNIFLDLQLIHHWPCTVTDTLSNFHISFILKFSFWMLGNWHYWGPKSLTKF